MGWRFNRRVKLLPGVIANFSKSGVSWSFGPRGAKVTVGHGKVRETIGLPGTGISYTKEFRQRDSARAHGGHARRAGLGLLGRVILFPPLSLLGLLLAAGIGGDRGLVFLIGWMLALVWWWRRLAAARRNKLETPPGLPADPARSTEATRIDTETH